MRWSRDKIAKALVGLALFGTLASLAAAAAVGLRTIHVVHTAADASTGSVVSAVATCGPAVFGHQDRNQYRSGFESSAEPGGSPADRSPACAEAIDQRMAQVWKLLGGALVSLALVVTLIAWRRGLWPGRPALAVSGH